ncbi:MAG: hypothetical protein JW894_08965 [Bacteroidales bacterium]|nr:hypothetical protein [Bacteroidales bacterium]
MKDELNRNINDLSLPGYDKPFYIAYTIVDVQNFEVNATLGALLSSDDDRYKDWHVRVMVGDYDLNDENYSYTKPQEAIFRPSIQMPAEDDYLGIRRSLWLTTNNVYHSAAQTYKSKVDLIKHKQLNKSDLEIPDFSKAPVENIYINSPMLRYNKHDLEQKARSISAVLKKYAEIHASGASLSVVESVVYFVNSEGSVVRYPLSLASVTVYAETMAEDGETIKHGITYVENDPDKLPSADSIIEDTKILAENLIELRNAVRLEENYSGPVLLQNEAAAGLFENLFFNKSENLIASRESLQSSSQMNVYYSQNDFSLESKIDKLVIAKNLSVISKPGLKKYNEIPLLGSFIIDAEGVIPQKNLILIEKGVLKTLLNGRTPSRNVPESNGHNRFSYSEGNFIKQVGPGVIKVENTEGIAFEQLKKSLIEQGKEEGLTEVILIKPLNVGGSVKPMNIYSIAVKTGEEHLLRGLKIIPAELSVLKRNVACSDNYFVSNVMVKVSYPSDMIQRNYLTGSLGLEGMPASFIVPDAVLIDEMNFSPIRKSLTSLTPTISNPVK